MATRLGRGNGDDDEDEDDEDEDEVEDEDEDKEEEEEEQVARGEMVAPLPRWFSWTPPPAPITSMVRHSARTSFFPVLSRSSSSGSNCAADPYMHANILLLASDSSGSIPTNLRQAP